MNKDFTKATNELLERLRRPNREASQASTLPIEVARDTSAGIVIHAPKDCVIYITPHTPSPPRRKDKS